MDIFIVRHTSVAVNRDTCYGQSDVPLNDSFPNEANKVKEKLGNDLIGSAVFYSSPLSRCTRLAEWLKGDSLTIDDRILELNFGDWELKKWNDIPRDKFDAWASDYVNNRCPGGESYIDLYEKSCEFWDEIVAKKHSNIVIITHFGVIHALLSYLLNMPLDKSFIVNVDFGGITKISIQKKRTSIVYINR